MMAATRDTSTRSTPTPIAVTARRSEAEARREPCGGREVAAQHQSEPHQRHAEQGAAARPPGHPYTTRGSLDPAAERGGHTPAGPADRSSPRGEPGAPAHRVEPAVATLPRAGGPRFTRQLHHARRELLADIV